MSPGSEQPALPAKKFVLITGCSDGGLGSAIALAFHRRGFHVFATVRDVGRAASIVRPGIEVLPLQVTSTESIAECVKTVTERTGGSLDVLVNNAGVMFVMPLLDTSIEESKKLYDVNVWGMLAVTQAFAPLLVKCKGVLLNISSIAGAVRMAWQGTYNSSKASARWISETLRIEMEPLGVRVLTAMVGEVETKIYSSASAPQLPENSYYKAVKDFIVKQGAGGFQNENEAAEVTAESLVRDVLSGRSGHTWRGGVAGRAKYFHWILPERLFEYALHSSRGVYNVTAP